MQVIMSCFSDAQSRNSDMFLRVFNVSSKHFCKSFLKLFCQTTQPAVAFIVLLLSISVVEMSIKNILKIYKYIFFSATYLVLQHYKTKLYSENKIFLDLLFSLSLQNDKLSENMASRAIKLSQCSNLLDCLSRKL